MALEPRIWRVNGFAGLIGDDLKDRNYSTSGGIIDGGQKEEKGRIVIHSFFLRESPDELVIKETHLDIRDNGFLTGIQTTIEWYNNDDSVFETKIYLDKLSISQAADVEKTRRKRQITYLQEAGRRLGVGQYINILFAHYKNEIIDYMENGTNEFLNAINNEKDEQINAILNHKLEDGDTVKKSITYQIS